jgi:uroporphyrinogen-III synthase
VVHNLMVRVLITRAEPEASALAALIMRCGHSAVIAPLAKLQSLDVTWPQDIPEAIVFTSANAPSHLSPKLLRALPVFTIGPRTADAARAAGFTQIVAHGNGDYAQLLRHIIAAPYRSLWHIGGRDVRHDMREDLLPHKIICQAFAVYDMVSTTALTPLAQAALVARSLDMALIFSPRSAQRAIKLLGDARVWLPVWTMSEAIAAPLRAAHWCQVHVSLNPNKHALLAQAGLMCKEATDCLKGTQDER